MRYEKERKKSNLRKNNTVKIEIRKMKIKNELLKFKTKKIFDFIDFTEKLKKFVEVSEIKEGILNIQLMHTSAGLIINENEPLLLEDIKDKLEDTASQSKEYRHDDLTKRTVNVCVDECKNGHSHCNAIHLPSTITLNILNKKLQLGRWQSVLLVELDSARHRTVQLQVLGNE